MLTRRGFASCALCAVTGFLATGAEAQNAPAGLKRTIITRMDGPMDGYQTVNVRVDLDAGALVPRHTHPGIEFELCRRRRVGTERRRPRHADLRGRGRIPGTDAGAALREERRQVNNSCGHLRARKGQAPSLARLKPGELESQAHELSCRRVGRGHEWATGARFHPPDAGISS